MSVPLYMDQHVKGAITVGLRKRGVDVVTCVEDGTDQSDDDQILARATQLGRAVFTQDDDFLGLADEWLRDGAISLA
jgi:predicted nuclease of predicted toxin-antitoxin system